MSFEQSLIHILPLMTTSHCNTIKVIVPHNHTHMQNMCMCVISELVKLPVHSWTLLQQTRLNSSTLQKGNVKTATTNAH
jgi:hypothetical protein